MNDHDTIVISNPDDQPFEAVLDNKIWAVIPPGQTAPLPRYIARVAVKHLIDRCIQKENQDAVLNEPGLRRKWAEKIVVEERIYQTPTANLPDYKRPEANPQVTDDLERVVRDTPTPPVNADLTHAAPTPPNEPKLETLERPDPPEVAEVKQEMAQPTESPTPPPADKERQTVYDWATSNFGLDQSHAKTMEKLNSMTLDEVKKELMYEAQ